MWGGDALVDEGVGYCFSFDIFGVGGRFVFEAEGGA